MPSATRHRAYLVLGSNIEPEKNLRLALEKLARECDLLAVSQAWETLAEGSPGPNFLNAAALIGTNHSAVDLKFKILRKIEAELGRVRSADKNAPRTIDLDILIFDGEILEDSLWQRIFIAVPLAELLPNLEHPLTCQMLFEAAREMREHLYIKARPDVGTAFRKE